MLPKVQSIYNTTLDLKNKVQMINIIFNFRRCVTKWKLDWTDTIFSFPNNHNAFLHQQLRLKQSLRLVRFFFWILVWLWHELQASLWILLKLEGWSHARTLTLPFIFILHANLEKHLYQNRGSKLMIKYFRCLQPVLDASRWAGQQCSKIHKPLPKNCAGCDELWKSVSQKARNELWIVPGLNREMKKITSNSQVQIKLFNQLRNFWKISDVYQCRTSDSVLHL